jgi:hypothetical protein
MMNFADISSYGKYPGRRMMTSVTTARHKNFPKNITLSESTDMTIHWKALEDNFLNGTISFFYSTNFGGKMHFLNYPQNPQSLGVHSIFLIWHLFLHFNA